jgi:hypothetical protein
MFNEEFSLKSETLLRFKFKQRKPKLLIKYLKIIQNQLKRKRTEFKHA